MGDIYFTGNIAGVALLAAALCVLTGEETPAEVYLRRTSGEVPLCMVTAKDVGDGQQVSAFLSQTRLRFRRFYANAVAGEGAAIYQLGLADAGHQVKEITLTTDGRAYIDGREYDMISDRAVFVSAIETWYQSWTPAE